MVAGLRSHADTDNSPGGGWCRSSVVVGVMLVPRARGAGPGSPVLKRRVPWCLNAGRAAWDVCAPTRWRRREGTRGGRPAGPAEGVHPPTTTPDERPHANRGAPPYTRCAVTGARAEVSAPRCGSVIEAGIQGRGLFWNRGRGWFWRTVFARAKVTARTGMRGIRHSAFGIRHSAFGIRHSGEVGGLVAPRGRGGWGWVPEAGSKTRRASGNGRAPCGRGGEEVAEWSSGRVVEWWSGGVGKGGKTGPGKAPPQQGKAQATGRRHWALALGIGHWALGIGGGVWGGRWVGCGCRLGLLVAPRGRGGWGLGSRGGLEDSPRLWQRACALRAGRMGATGGGSATIRDEDVAHRGHSGG